MSKDSSFFHLLNYLTAHQKESVYENCWRDLAEKSIRIAYSSNSLKEVNTLLMEAPTDIRKRLVSWFKRLGIQVVVHRQTRGGFRAIAIEDKTRQREVLLAAKTLPLRTTTVIATKDNDKPWFDDLEQEARGHSVHAFQGGRASGK